MASSQSSTLRVRGGVGWGCGLRGRPSTTEFALWWRWLELERFDMVCAATSRGNQMPKEINMIDI